MDRECSRYFTLEEANALIPSLEAGFSRILQMRAQMRAAYQEMESHGETPSTESLGRTDGPESLRILRGRFRGLMEALQEEVQSIEEAGVQVKDLDTGLCDFLGRRAEKDILLCWRFGEKRIGFWHDLTSGFSGRQPIETTHRPGLS